VHQETDTLKLPNTNWALAIDKVPFLACAVTCGITFTYGGIATDGIAGVLNNKGKPMPNWWAVAEISGGLFYHNYPGGAGLTKGAVFGRIAGREPALVAKGR
jgi:tricarballylate dehydrogenase